MVECGRMKRFEDLWGRNIKDVVLEKERRERCMYVCGVNEGNHIPGLYFLRFSS